MIAQHVRPGLSKTIMDKAVVKLVAQANTKINPEKLHVPIATKADIKMALVRLVASNVDSVDSKVALDSIVVLIVTPVLTLIQRALGHVSSAQQVNTKTKVDKVHVPIAPRANLLVA